MSVATMVETLKAKAQAKPKTAVEKAFEALEAYHAEIEAIRARMAPLENVVVEATLEAGRTLASSNGKVVVNHRATSKKNDHKTPLEDAIEAGRVTAEQLAPYMELNYTKAAKGLGVPPNTTDGGPTAKVQYKP